jgi:hypothetical protein
VEISELEILLQEYDRTPTECDGCTRLISHGLAKAGVVHQVFQGVCNQFDGDRLVRSIPHYWIDLLDGFRVDYRLRMWMGQSDQIPHGIFVPSQYPNLKWIGEPFTFSVLPEAILKALTTPFPIGFGLNYD